MAVSPQSLLCSLIKKRLEQSDPEKYVLFLGAGASLSSGPSLFSTIITASGCSNYDDFSRLCDGLSHQERFSLLSEHLAIRSPSRSAVLLADLIKQGWFSLILTTNFDSLLEHSFHAAGLSSTDYQVLVNEPGASNDSIAASLFYGSPRIKVLKLHGDILRRRFAITRKETAEFNEAIASCLTRIFAERDVIIIGSQFSDLDLLRTISNRGGSLWYVSPSQPTGHLATLLEVRNSREHVISGSDGNFDTFVKSLSRAALTPRQLEYKIAWYLLCPFSFRWDDRSRLQSKYALKDKRDDMLELSIVSSESEELVLTAYPCDVAVLCRRTQIEATRISEFARRRRIAYSDVLRSKAGLASIARELTTLHSQKLWLGHDEGVAYCFSIVNVLRSAWRQSELANAMTLFACPSVLYADETGDERNDPPEPTLIDETREDAILASGCAVDDCDSFCVQNNILGCTSWSGAALCEQRPAAISVANFIAFENRLQAAWWGIHRAKKATIASVDASEATLLAPSFWRRELARLQHSEATDSIMIRRLRESVFRTSRIREEYTELKEMMP